ncbi:MAG TPA: M28 family metallopeptidase [Vicinamibacterales bacterium]
MVGRFAQQIFAGIALAAFVAGCGSAPAASAPQVDAPVSLDTPAIDGALKGISGDRIKQHMTVLASDELEGRGLGSTGYEAALQYVEKTLTADGLAPAGENGGFRQRVALRNSVVVQKASSFRVTSKGATRTLAFGKDYLLAADQLRENVSIDDAPVVFVGYGVSAPAQGYDDYGTGLDVKGKVVAYLSGAPAKLPSTERAYYSSGAVKDAEAVKRGAIGTISFTSPDDPRFRWDVSVATGAQGNYAWVDAAGKPSRGEAALRGSVSLNHSGVAALFAGAAKPPAEVFAAAAKSEPQAFDLATRVSITTQSTHTSVESANVVARLEGVDPALKNESVVYIAHVDHFGRGVAMKGDDIYNGAHDNASGVAIVLELARAFKALPSAPRRSVVFLFVTAEERGLLGSDYFARNPTVPAAGIVADLTLDMPFLYHPLKDIVPYGAQHSTLSAPVTKAAAKMGIGIGEDPIPEQVLFIRSDHYSFVRQGVPSLFIKSGFQTGDGRDGSAINAAYRRDVYHKPNDDMSQAFDFEAGADHARINFLTGWQVAQESARPAWNPNDFFGDLFGKARPAQSR